MKEIIRFDGTVHGLKDQLDLIVATYPKTVAFMLDQNGDILNKLTLETKATAFGGETWDATISVAKK